MSAPANVSAAVSMASMLSMLSQAFHSQSQTLSLGCSVCEDLYQRFQSPKHYNSFSHGLLVQCLRYAQRQETGPEQPRPTPRAVVSVGSGSGKLEKRLCEIGVQNLIAVDPSPEAPEGMVGDGVVHMKPQFATVDALLEARPDLKGQCVLFIGWALPDCVYDIEAIQKLEPTSVISVYGRAGAAGGHAFRSWLKSIDLPAISSGSHADFALPAYVEQYHRVRRRAYDLGQPNLDETVLVWLARADCLPSKSYLRDSLLLKHTMTDPFDLPCLSRAKTGYPCGQ